MFDHCHTKSVGFANRDRANNWWYPAVRIDSNIDIMDSEG